jgi:predicted amino acid dehydrogenase
MAEGMLLALEGIRDRSFTGELTVAHVRRISALAERHGFALAECRPRTRTELVDVPT